MHQISPRKTVLLHRQLWVSPVFVMSALVGPAFGWLLQRLAGGSTLSEDVFVKADSVFVVAVVLAAILAVFLKETGSAAQKAR